MSPYRDGPRRWEPRPPRIRGHWWVRLCRKLMFVNKQRWCQCGVCHQYRLLKNLVHGRWGGGPAMYVCRHTKLAPEKYASCMHLAQHLKWS